MVYLFKVLIAFYLFGFSAIIQAQYTIPAAGGSTFGTGGTVSYSLGQVVYSTISGTDGNISMGVQQPFEISAVTAIEKSKCITLDIIVYPNPAADFLTLKIKNYDVENLSCRLYDISGNLLQNKKVVADETRIAMQNFSLGTYFLKVISGHKELITFKIIKN